MNHSKVKIITESILSKILRTVAVIWILLGVCAILGGKNETIGYYVMCLVVFGVVGVWVFWIGFKKKKRIKSFQDYVKVIANDPNGCIENIAATMGTSPDAAKKELTQLIDKKYFPNAYINQETNCIVINNRNAEVGAEQTASGQNKEGLQEMAYEVVTCKCCGGISKVVKEKAGECEFCGSPLH